MSFVKLDTGILDSSLWAEDAVTCKVFITMLAMCDPGGLVRATAPGIARRANISSDDARRSISILESPDPESRSSAEEGRRIKRVEGGYLVVNYLKYRAVDYTAAERKRRWREARRNGGVTVVTRDIVTATEAEAEAEAEADTDADTTTKTLVRSRARYTPGFEKFWSLYPRRVSKALAFKRWTTHKCEGAQEKILAALDAAIKTEWAGREVRFVPHPATWLNQERWNDELPDSPVVAPPVDPVLKAVDEVVNEMLNRQKTPVPAPSSKSEG